MNKQTSGSGDGVSLSMGTLLGNMERYIKRDLKMPCKHVSLSIGAPVGNLEGICLPGLFE